MYQHESLCRHQELIHDLTKGFFISGFLADQKLEEFHLLETTGVMDGGTGDFERFRLELEESDGLIVDNYIPLY